MDNIYNLFTYDKDLTVCGLTSELNVFYVLNLFNKKEKNILVVTSSLFEANKLFDLFKTYTSDVLLFPMDDFITSMALAISPELKATRIDTLQNIKNGPKIVITNLMGYLKYLTDINQEKTNVINLQSNMVIKRDELIAKLNDFGYVRESIVTTTGEFAVRGFVIDLFPIQENHPIRLELFGDLIEEIKYFDENTQKTIKKTNNVKIIPVEEIETNNKSSLYEYLSKPIVINYDFKHIENSYNHLSDEIIDYKKSKDIDKEIKFMFDYDEIKPEYSIYINTYSDDVYKKNKSLVFNSKEIDNFNSNFENLQTKVNKWLKDGKEITFCLPKSNEITEIKKLFGIKVNYLKQRLNKGFIIDKYVFITDLDIEKNISITNSYKSVYKMGRRIKDYDDLNQGDYVVHINSGIGVYAGLITLTTNGLKKDYLEIDYLNNDKLYVPVEKINTIFKYSSGDGAKPNINSLGSSNWIKKKNSIKARIKDISGELIKLYAARKSVKSDSYKGYPEEIMFANEFEYELTKDQATSIKDIDRDLFSCIPMDRLLCGDVGFGKTEVAFRAMFKTVLNNKQVAYLCPTTILSNQQYTSALSRFKSYPIEIALLNRFTSSKETKRILEGIKKGTIDIVFGTHRILSDDIEFKKLGLLVVDEEQRFGVTHKEKIKKLKNNINVLTLSATPIPRTLKMALSGLRDLSIIDTPPVNRYPIQTYVISDDDLIVKDAIYKELARHGQIFILYNNIEKLIDKQTKIAKLVPEARIAIAHGRMTKYELEKIMSNFINYEYDILLCTTIIETGIDIPNANTLIIYDADHYGLSQLYQIRGRVGRTNKIAYAYLLYDKNKMLNDIAIKRLNAIKEFTELGSGYRIAMRDLSIRGAGDILGSEQAGFVSSVGMTLYLKMIEDELKRQNNEEIIEDEDINNKSLINVETHISDDYVSDDDLKIEIHGKINEIDSLNKLNEVKQELEDRFGKISENMLIYMYEEYFEAIASRLEIKNVKQTNLIVEVELPENISNNIKGDKLLLEAYNINPKFKLNYSQKTIKISLPINNNEEHFIIYFIKLLEKIEN